MAVWLCALAQLGADARIVAEPAARGPLPRPKYPLAVVHLTALPEPRFPADGRVEPVIVVRRFLTSGASAGSALKGAAPDIEDRCLARGSKADRPGRTGCPG